MNETIVLGIAVLTAWVFMSYLRIPATVLFLSILIGKLFAEELSLDVFDFISGVAPVITPKGIQIGLLVLPAILTVIFLKGTVLKAKIFINAIPLLLCLITLALFLNPYFDVVSRLDEQQRIILTDNQNYVVAVSGLITLLSTWLAGKSSSGHRKKK